MVDGTLAPLLAEVATLPRSAVVVEDRHSGLFKLEHVQLGFAAELLAAVQARYPSVPIEFLETGRWSRSGPSGSCAPRSPTLTTTTPSSQRPSTTRREA